MSLPQHNTAADYTEQILDLVKTAHIINTLTENITNGNYLSQPNSPVNAPIQPGAQLQRPVEPLPVIQPVNAPAIQPVQRARSTPASGFVSIGGRDEYVGTGE